MDAVPIVHIDAVIDVFQHEEHALRQFIRSRNHRMKSTGLLVQITIVFDVIQQVEPELVQAQIHNGDAVRHIFDVNDLFLQAFQLCLAILQITLFFGVDKVIIAGGGHNGDFHAGLHTGFQVDVIVQRQIRPEIHKLDVLVSAADTVDSSKTLDDAYRVPVNVIVDQIIAVLQVLAFRNAVCCNQHINFRGTTGHQNIPVFGNGREAGQHVVECCLEAFDRGTSVNRAGNYSGIQPIFLLYKRTHIVKEVLCRIRKCRENQHFSVAGIDRVLNFFRQQLEQFLQLCVMLRRDICHHKGQQLQNFCIFPKLRTPALPVHIRKVDFDFFADGEKISVFIVHVKIVSGHVVYIQISVAGAFKLVNGLNRTINQFLDAYQGQLERMYRAFQPLQQVNTHQPANALLTTSLGQILTLIVRQLLILLELTCEDIVGGHIDAQAQLNQLLINFVVVDGIIQVRQAWTDGNRLQPLWELSDSVGVVVLLDMLPRTCDGNTVQQLEEVEIQCPQQRIRGSLFWFQFAPCVKGFLRLLKDVFNAL